MTKTKKLVLTSVLTAIIVLMGFTPLGYLKTPFVEVTFLMIPVAIGAILLGPNYGAYFGFVFGLTSFLQCFGYSAFGVAILSLSVVGTLICTIAARTLMGYLAGHIYLALSKTKLNQIVSFLITSISAALLNTIFFTGCFLLFFRNKNFPVFETDMAQKSVVEIVAWLVGLNGLVEILVCGVISTPLAKALVHFLPKFDNKRKEKNS